MTRLFDAFDSAPPTILIITAILSIQLGSALATWLFPSLGTYGTAAARIILSALILLWLVPGSLKTYWRLTVAHWTVLVPYGLCICAMNVCFYLAISKIPLGATVAIEFMGPLGVALLASRKLIHVFWVCLAAIGVFLLSPISNAGMNLAGTLFALSAGLGWAFFIVLSKKVSARIEGHAGLAIGMTIAGLVMCPLLPSVVSSLVADPKLLVSIMAVAVLATALPFALEFSALKRTSNRMYGILISLEPAAAVVIGMLVLSEHLGLLSLGAVALIIIAAAGMALTEDKSIEDPAAESSP